jgi:predicted GNAT family N-acyltransferase
LLLVTNTATWCLSLNENPWGDAQRAAGRARPGLVGARLGAQLRAIPFYERLGFQARGPVFLDAGIEHRDMVLVFE